MIERLRQEINNSEKDSTEESNNHDYHIDQKEASEEGEMNVDDGGNYCVDPQASAASMDPMEADTGGGTVDLGTQMMTSSPAQMGEESQVSATYQSDDNDAQGVPLQNTINPTRKSQRQLVRSKGKPLCTAEMIDNAVRAKLPTTSTEGAMVKKKRSRPEDEGTSAPQRG